MGCLKPSDVLGTGQDVVCRIKEVLQHCVAQYATNDARMFTVFDGEGSNFLVIEEGWICGKHLYSTFVHIEQREGCLWVLQDFTNHGIAHDLIAAGTPRDCIVLAYKAPRLRDVVDWSDLP